MFYEQLLQQLKVKTGFQEEKVIEIVNYNVRQMQSLSGIRQVNDIDCLYKRNLFTVYETTIQNIVFTGIKKGVFEETMLNKVTDLLSVPPFGRTERF